MIQRQIRTYSRHKIFSAISGYREELRQIDLESIEYLHHGELIPEGSQIIKGPRGGKIISRHLSPAFIWKPLTNIPKEVITVWGAPTHTYAKQVVDRGTGSRIRRDFYLHPEAEYDPVDAEPAFIDAAVNGFDEDPDDDALTVITYGIGNGEMKKVVSYDDGAPSGLISYKIIDNAVCIDAHKPDRKRIA